MLGANLHENGTVRQVVRVDLLSPPVIGTMWSDYRTPAGMPRTGNEPRAELGVDSGAEDVAAQVYACGQLNKGLQK